MNPEKYYWTSWYSNADSIDLIPKTPFNWCITGSTEDKVTICAEIKGKDKEDVWNTVSSFFVINQERFCDLQDQPHVFGDRFACLMEEEK